MKDSQNSNSGSSDLARRAAHLIEQSRSGLSEASAVGRKKLGQMAEVASVYLNKYKNDAIMSSLKLRKQQKLMSLGPVVYRAYKDAKLNAAAAFKTSEVAKILVQVEAIERQILTTGEKLDRKSPQANKASTRKSSKKKTGGRTGGRTTSTDSQGQG